MNDSNSLEQQLCNLKERVAELEERDNAAPLSGTLRAIVEGTATVSNDLFFETLVRYLAKSVDAAFAFIGEFSESRTHIRTRAVWAGGKPGENFEYELAGTPCETVLNGKIAHYTDNIQQLFPENPLLKALGVRSYLAVPLVSSSGEVLGHLAIMDVNPKAESDTDLNIFHIFAARATAELERRAVSTQLSETTVRQQRTEAEVSYLRKELQSAQTSSRIIGASNALQDLMNQLDLVARTDSTVLILGESGTGKELLAAEIHARSRRCDQPFIRVNCAALPESLIESELFGHQKGAFTGATETRSGRFELADRGTLFLDEIGELPLAGQARLLRVLQEGEFERVGGGSTIHVDVRVLAATNRDLHSVVDEGNFRQDLYYRLNVVPLASPPLRDRREDIPLLVNYFVEKFQKTLSRAQINVPAEFIDRLCKYDWPGNIRELQNVIERAMILSPGNELCLPAGALPLSIAHGSASPLMTLAENERNHIIAALDACSGVIGGPKGAAQLLDVNKSTLRSRMDKLNIRPNTLD